MVSASIPRRILKKGATGAMVVANRIFWALGYNQVETFITTIDRSTPIDPKATVRRPSGARTPMTRDDMDAVLSEPRAGLMGDTVPRPDACFQAGSSEGSVTPALDLMIPTTSSLTSIAAICARCESSVPGPT